MTTLAIAFGFFFLLSAVLMVLVLRASAPVPQGAAVAPPQAAAKPRGIADSPQSTVQLVAQPQASAVEKELRQRVQQLEGRVSELQVELTTARAEAALARVRAGAGEGGGSAEAPAGTAQSRAVQEQQGPTLLPGPVKSSLGAGNAALPTRPGDWTIRELPQSAKDNFGAWKGSATWGACPDGQWRWIGRAERGRFVFDSDGIGMQSTSPGGGVERVANVVCEGGELKFQWCVASTLDMAEKDWHKRLKDELRSMGIAVGSAGGGVAQWIRFNKPEAAVVGPGEPTTLSTSEPWRGSGAGGGWTTLEDGTRLVIEACGTECEVECRLRSGSAGGSSSVWELAFHWPADINDDELTTLDTKIKTLDEEIIAAREALKMTGGNAPQDQGGERKLAQSRLMKDEKQRDEAQKARESIRTRRKDFAACIGRAGTLILLGPLESVPAIELTVRIDKPLEVSR